MLFVQVMFGMAEGTPYKKAYEANLEKAVANGDLTVVEFHERKNGFKFADARGVDDGTSCTKGIVEGFLKITLICRFFFMYFIDLGLDKVNKIHEKNYIHICIFNVIYA